MQESKILSIKKVPTKTTVYNFGVQDNNNYFANDVLTHNCHAGSAEAYAKFLNRLAIRYKGGLTATPTRKDNRHFIHISILGRPTVRSSIMAMLPQIVTWETGIRLVNKSWPGMMKTIADHPRRNALIANQVFKDFEKGHECIIIPVEYVRHMKTLSKMIQARADKLRQKKEWSHLPKKVAFEFWSGTKDRQQLLRDIDAKPFRVLIAVRKLVKQGIDLSRPTMLYNVIPISNKQMFYQLCNRVCTTREGKRQPVVRLLLDHHRIQFLCWRIILTQEVFKHLRTKKGGRYIVSDHELNKVRRIMGTHHYESFGSTKRTTGKVEPQVTSSWARGG